MIIVDHAFMPSTSGDEFCGCGVAKYLHASELSRECAEALQRRIKPMVTLPSGPPVRSDYERALERIRELEAERLEMGTGNVALLTQIEVLKRSERELRSQRQILMDSERDLNVKLSLAESRAQHLAGDLYDSEAERLRANERAGDIQLRLDESLAREGTLNTRLKNLDTLAREVSARVEKMLASVDKPPSVA